MCSEELVNVDIFIYGPCCSLSSIKYGRDLSTSIIVALILDINYISLPSTLNIICNFCSKAVNFIQWISHYPADKMDVYSNYYILSTG